MATKYRSLIQSQVRMANIPFGERGPSVAMILEATRNVRVIKKTFGHLYCPMRGCQVAERPPYPTAGRPSLEAETTYIISVLRYVWLKSIQKKPTANRRGDPDSPFVRFAEPILNSVGIFNTLDNLSRYSRSTKSLRA